MGLNLTILETVPDKNLKGRTGHSGIGTRYAKYYPSAVQLKPWLLEQIAASKNGIVNVKNSLLREAMGGSFTTKSPTSVYWALKYILYLEGIWVGTGTSVDESEPNLLTFRLVVENDQLPASLAKYLPKNKNVDENINESEIKEESETKDE